MGRRRLIVGQPLHFRADMFKAAELESSEIQALRQRMVSASLWTHA
jgi:hypothetical protein